MPSHKKVGRKRVGKPFSVVFTDAQRAWIDAQIVPGGTRTEVIRKVVQAIMDGELAKPCWTGHCHRRKKETTNALDDR